MLTKSTFIPRIKVPNHFSNITLKRSKMGLKVVSSNSLISSMRPDFTNCAQDYVNYDAEVFLKKNRTYVSCFG